MLSKAITYTDYNGEERTEVFYFNLTKAELAELNLTTKGGLQDVLRKIVDSKDVPELTKWFKKIILMSYGEKFMELITDEVAAANFVNGLLPNIENPNIPAPPVSKSKGKGV